MLIAFEGPDEVGKTALARALTERLCDRGFSAEYVALPGHDVGSLGHHIYQLHHNPSGFGLEYLDPTSRQILHVASHVDQLNRIIAPRLADGVTVVLDRYWWSAPVYAQAFGVPTHIVDALADFERAVWRSAPADVVFLVKRGLPLKQNVAPAIFVRLRETYDAFAAAEKHQFVVTVLNERDLDSAVAIVEDAVTPMLPHRPPPNVPRNEER